MVNITCLGWMALLIYTFYRIQAWNRKFAELYDEMMKEVNDND